MNYLSLKIGNFEGQPPNENSHGQANPSFKNGPTDTGSTRLVSRWLVSYDSTIGYFTDHVFVEYGSKFYDPSYEHSSGASYSSINALTDAGISHYIYDKKWRCQGGSYVDESSTLPTVSIWMGPYPADTGNYLIVSNSGTADEMEN